MPAIAAAALCPGRIELSNIPDITDVEQLCVGLRYLGVAIERSGDRLLVPARNGPVSAIPGCWSQGFRGSIYGIAVAAARFGRASLGGIGGDRLIGRGLNIHARAFEAHGFEVDVGPGRFALRGRLRPATYRLDDRPGGISASATALLLAAAADGRSTIRGVSDEPEVRFLAELLSAMGATIESEGGTARVEGPLSARHVVHRVDPDRIVWGTLAIAAAITGGEIILPRIPNAETIVDILRQAGVEVAPVGGARLRVKAGRLSSIEVATGPHPALTSDLVPPLTVLMAVANGRSSVRETIYPNRYAHMAQLGVMGVNYRTDGPCLSIEGGAPLKGGRVSGDGIRETAALLVAGLAAQGRTHIENAQDVWRGYADLPGQLRGLGADIEWADDMADDDEGVRQCMA